jgi:hypothetical protein
MFDEVLVNVLEGALELLLGGHHLPGVGQQEAGHLTETGTQVCPNKQIIMFKIFFFGGGGFFTFFVLYSTLLHLPTLRFHCTDGCWNRTQDRCNWCIGSQTL